MPKSGDRVIVSHDGAMAAIAKEGFYQVPSRGVDLEVRHFSLSNDRFAHPGPLLGDTLGDRRWSAEETDDPLHADRRNFYMVEKWSRGVKGADMKIIVAAAVLPFRCVAARLTTTGVFIAIRSQSPTVVGDGNSVLVSNAQNEADGQELAEKHCKRFGKAHGSIGWKAYEHFSIANPLRECEPVIWIVRNRRGRD